MRLLIIDEAHQVVTDNDDHAKIALAEHSSRSLRLEGLVSRILAQKPDIVRIALTAVAGGAALPVAQWIEGRVEADAIGTQYRSTRQIIGMLETIPHAEGRILLDLMNGQQLYVRARQDPVYIRLRTPAMPQLPSLIRGSLNHFNQLNVLWTALHLIEGERRILISVAQEPEQTMRWFAEAFELTAWRTLQPFTEPQEDDSRARFRETHDACIDYCGEHSYELALLKRGIATNHGQMPQRLRRLMTALIERRICPITLATATLTEGVNLPFDLIFLTSLQRTFYDPISQRQDVSPLSTSEFRNLAGRAGRPGAAKGMEGMTLVAVPQRPSATAPKQLPLQYGQIRELKRNYEDLLTRLLAEELNLEGVISPLGLLLKTIADYANKVLGISGEVAFLNWLETAIPVEISEDVGLASVSPQARLADNVDELDGVLLAAIEELSRLENHTLDGQEAEVFLINLWQRTFTTVAAKKEAWLERAFIRRGRAIVEQIYPDSGERRRLYQYGFAPCVGRKFEAISPTIHAELASAISYGSSNAADQLSVFLQLGTLLTGDRGFGFRVRDTATDRALLQRWPDVLAWWMQGPDAPWPEPENLRAWQRFVADNLEFRLGVAIGAVVAQAWSDGAIGSMEVPSLAVWRETTKLSWFAFWARELLRWGTLDPFVAFALALGLARTRADATAMRPEYEAWLRTEIAEVNGEDLIDPQRFLKWQKNLSRRTQSAVRKAKIRVKLTGTTGQRGRYAVVPVVAGDEVIWLDAAGFELARSFRAHKLPSIISSRHDYDLIAEDGGTTVQREFTAR